MKKLIKLTLASALTICLCSTFVFAVDSEWTLDGNADWTNTLAWSAGIPGAGDIAYFTNTYVTAKITATPRNSDNVSIGEIHLGTTRVQLPSWGQVPTATNMVLDNGGGTPIIDVNTARLDCQVVLEGTDGFTLNGQPGSILMIGATPKPISGPVLLQDVLEVIYNHLDSLMNADITIQNTTVRARQGGMTSKSINIGNAGFLNLTEKTEQKVTGIPINVNAGGTLKLSNPAVMTGSNIVVNNGGEFQVVAPGVSTLENDLSIDGNGITAALGAFHTFGNNVNVTNNGDVYFAGNARFTQYGIGGYLVQNGTFTGPGNLEMLAQAGHWTHFKTFFLNGPDTRTGNTILSGFAAVPTFEIGGHQHFPNTPLTLQIHEWATGDTQLYYDLNSYTQQITQLTINSGTSGGDLVEIRGSASAKLTATGVGNYGSLMNGGQILLSGGTFDAVNSIIGMRLGAELTVTGSTVHTTGGLGYILMNHGPGNSFLNVGEDGLVDVQLLRLADMTDPANLSPVVNLNAGGTIKTSLIWIDGTNSPTAIFRFDGGTLENHESSVYDNNWIWGDHSTVIADGGANISVDRDITIQAPLLHDPAASAVDGGLTKLGPSNLTLTANCTYTGPTTVSEGKLNINGTTASSGITLASGTAIGGTGTIPAMTIPTGATIAPGASIGTLSSGSITMDAGSEYDWEVGDPVSADLLDVAGTFSIPAGGMTVNVIKAGAPNGVYTLVQTTGGIVGDEFNITMNYGSGISGSDAYIVGTDLIADVIPEPATLGVLAILGLAFLRRK
ncbi:MAG: hypothetical protein DRQ43_10390 [Gammaproteobacteria bacterium]|nr:MAG: hypothetical protein DRQ43_10390 [Gammaproteobacteria bacterium]